MNDTSNDSPAHQLEGLVLKSGWTIGQKRTKKPGMTGGTFCVGYTATRGGEEAFVKAIDFVGALSQADPFAALTRLSQEAEWEKSILEHCVEKKMSRIVRLLDHELVYPSGSEGDATKRVSVLVTEKGEGDLREKLDLIGTPAFSWRIYVLRDVGLALDQLHSSAIAHLDVKPSNVISIEASGSVNGAATHAVVPSMKLTDLARVVRRGSAGPWDSVPWPGDGRYMPPEKWYGFHLEEWRDERVASDAFMLGSLFVFLFLGLSMGSLYQHYLPEPFMPDNWAGGFDGELLDVLIRAQSQALAHDIAPALPEALRPELLAIVKELTHPDPRVRGDPKARRAGQVGVDRYHQRLLTLAKRLDLLERHPH